MDGRVAAVALLLVAALLASASTSGAPPGPATTRELTLEVTEVPCPKPRTDGKACLAYNGQVPGPTLDVNLGDTVVVRLVNRLAEGPVSFHVHGTSLAADMDGLGAHPGTRLVESFAPPGGERTYRMRAAFAGTWHYHDHVLGHDGAEGVERGLFGALLVRTGGEPRPQQVLDLHLLDDGANAGRGLDATAAAGARIDIAVVGMGDRVWDVELRAPNGTLVGKTLVGPGVSERLRIERAEVGTYAWSAQMHGLPLARSGTVVVS